MKKKNFALAAIATLLMTTTAHAQLQPGDFVAICGDSITEQRIHSVMIEAYLLACSPVPDLELTQFGWSGERIWGLNARYNNVIAPFGATVATTCYGMNDGAFSKVSPGLLLNYSNHLVSVVGKMKDSGVRFIVLGSPGIIDAAAIGDANSIMGRPISPADYNETLRSLGEVVRQVSQENGLGFADVHGAMVGAVAKAQAARGKDYTISKDGVHPFENGQLVMAYAFLKGMGCDGDIGTITADWTASSATADANQTIRGMKDGVIDVESRRYPFFLAPGEKSPREMSEYFPFNDELNRYMLVVENAPAKARVTWGDASREYTAEELGRGVNLAADFPDGPFTGPFTNLVAKIQERQAYETVACKSAIETLPKWKEIIPEKDAELEALRQGIMDKIAAKRKETRALVKPVAHSIKIEAL